MRLAPPYLSCKLTKTWESHSYAIRNGSKWGTLEYPPVTAQRSFFFRAVKPWNRLEIHSNRRLKSLTKAARQEILLL